MTVPIRRIAAADWQQLRAFRLAALAAAPQAFGSTLGAEQLYTDELWRERAAGAASGCARATFVAESDGAWIGAVTGLAGQPGEAGAALVVAMFVAASSRRSGVGVGLVEALASWARECGHARLALWVTAGNAPAIALYQRCGFRITGETKPRAHAPELMEQRMLRHHV